MLCSISDVLQELLQLLTKKIIIYISIGNVHIINTILVIYPFLIYQFTYLIF